MIRGFDGNASACDWSLAKSTAAQDRTRSARLEARGRSCLPVEESPPLRHCQTGIRQPPDGDANTDNEEAMRLTFQLHDASPPFVEICLETWRQDVHGGAPILSPQLMTAQEVRKSCANFRAQLDRVEREAIAALAAMKKSL